MHIRRGTYDEPPGNPAGYLSRINKAYLLTTGTLLEKEECVRACVHY